MDIQKSEAFAEGYYASIQVVSEYMKNRWNNLIDPILPKPETGFRDACIKTLFCRAVAWLQTLEKMNHTVCFQAVVSSNRSLMEIVVDLILLHHDKTNHSGWKMYWWGLSEKLKACEETIEFYKGPGMALPDMYEPRQDFINREKAQIEDMRKILWPTKTGHPRRWTGKDLKDDLKQADVLHGDLVKKELTVTLREVYQTEFRLMSWQAHSGVAGVWNVPPESFNMTCGFAFLRSADLGMLCTKIVLKDFGLTDHLQGLDREWNLLKEYRAKAFFDIQTQRLGKMEI